MLPTVSAGSCPAIGNASTTTSHRVHAALLRRPPFFLQLELESNLEKGRANEADAVFGRADHWHPEGSRGRRGGDRSEPTARDVERDPLPITLGRPSLVGRRCPM